MLAIVLINPNAAAAAAAVRPVIAFGREAGWDKLRVRARVRQCPRRSSVCNIECDEWWRRGQSVNGLYAGRTFFEWTRTWNVFSVEFVVFFFFFFAFYRHVRSYTIIVVIIPFFPRGLSCRACDGGGDSKRRQKSMWLYKYRYKSAGESSKKWQEPRSRGLFGSAADDDQVTRRAAVPAFRLQRSLWCRWFY